MKSIHKTISAFLSLILAFLSLVLFAMAAPLVAFRPVRNVIDLIYSSWLYASLGIVLFLIFVWLFFFFVRRTNQEKKLSREIDLGELHISFTALENLVLRATRQISSLRDVKTKLENSEAGLIIYLKVVAEPDVNIPEITENLQQNVKDYLEKTAGATVASIKVLVEDVSKKTVDSKSDNR